MSARPRSRSSPSCSPRRPRRETDHAALAERALDEHILPGFERLSAAATALDAAAEAACAGDGPIETRRSRPPMREAFDAWAGIGHIRFGPAEEDNNGFAIEFWPDTKGSTPRTLAALVAAEDPVVDDPPPSPRSRWRRAG